MIHNNENKTAGCEISFVYCLLRRSDLSKISLNPVDNNKHEQKRSATLWLCTTAVSSPQLCTRWVCLIFNCGEIVDLILCSFLAVNGVNAAAPLTPQQPILTSQHIVTTVIPLGPHSTHTICPSCGSEINTKTRSSPGLIAYVSGFLIAVFGCWLGCCLVKPFSLKFPRKYFMMHEEKTFYESFKLHDLMIPITNFNPSQIPCCIDECMDIHHSCPSCGGYLGRHRR